MKDDCRPQGDADRLRPDTASSEDGNRAEIVDHHRGDHSSRCAALFVVTREPAGKTQREQRHPGHAAKGNACAGNIGTEQKPDNDGGHAYQSQSSGCFDDSGECEQTFHGVWSDRRAALSDRLPRRSVAGEWLVCCFGDGLCSGLLIRCRHLRWPKLEGQLVDRAGEFERQHVAVVHARAGVQANVAAMRLSVYNVFMGVVLDVC